MFFFSFFSVYNSRKKDSTLDLCYPRWKYKSFFVVSLLFHNSKQYGEDNRPTLNCAGRSIKQTNLDQQGTEYGSGIWRWDGRILKDPRGILSKVKGVLCTVLLKLKKNASATVQ